MFLPQQPQQPEPKPEQKIVQFSPSSQLLRLKNVNRLSIYGFWFMLGVTAANLSRAIAHGWILYWLLLFAVAGWLVFMPSQEQEEESVARRRISGFALALSSVAFWDLIATISFLPIHILQWILPLWQWVALGIVALILLVVFLGIIS